MADEKKIQDPTVEFILRTAEAEPEADLRAFVGEMLGHSAAVGGLTDSNPTIDAIMGTLKDHGTDIASAAAIPLGMGIGAGVAGKGKRLAGATKGAVGGAGVGVGLQVLMRLVDEMGGERKSLPHPADYKGADTVHTSGGPLKPGETPPSASTLGEFLSPTS